MAMVRLQVGPKRGDVIPEALITEVNSGVDTFFSIVI
jgi:hypothetical protein